MYNNVINTLERAFALHKLDLTIKQVIAPCLPRAADADTSIEWDNLRLAVIYASHCNFRFADMHFWMQETGRTLYPTPTSPEDGFRIPADHPHFNEIREWIYKANDLEAKIGDAKVYLNRVLRVMKHPMWVHKFWPEIVPYVGAMPDTMTKAMREPRPTALNLDMPLQDEIQNLLTTAALLPKGEKPNAWVGVMSGGRS